MKADPKQEQVAVIVAANGFMVRPATDYREGTSVLLSGYHVFETFEGLIEHLRTVLPQPEKQS